MLLTEIENKQEFFKEFNISKKSMTHLLYVKGPNNFYQSFEIPKKNGSLRKIDAPKGKLKYVQKRLAELLWINQVKVWKDKEKSFEYNIYQKNLYSSERYRVPMISHAFETNKSIITNSKIHRNKNYVLNIDLKDFFKSFHFGRVKGFFEKNKDFKVPTDVAITIAQLSCYKGVLPQGAPSSPIITNLICQIMDYKILRLAKKHKLDYTRYADDLTFSTNCHDIVNEYSSFLDELEKEVNKAGFKINEDKTRIQYNTSRQMVTGIIVNKKLGIPREYCKDTRAMADRLYKTGSFEINEKVGNMNQLNGRFAFINQLDKYNNKLENKISLAKNSIEHQKNLFKVEKKGKKYATRVRQFNRREKEYQKFLFYKNFYGNEFPTIVTEGKTDVRYIKGALKSQYKFYPSLIEKDSITNEFHYKINFLNRSKCLRYFFDLELDGADSITKLYNFFSDRDDNSYPNYLKEFKNKKYLWQSKPTIFLFDNEMINKKPLRKFINSSGIDKLKIDKLKKNLHVEIEENLYLATHNLIGTDTENELEDLFLSQTLSKVIDGKTFDKDGGEDFYGKEIFSQYVLSNYVNIDFKNFAPLLNMLNSICSDENHDSKIL